MQFVKCSERMPEVSPENETLTRFIVDDRNEEGYGKVWLMTYHDLKDLAHYQKDVRWLDESPESPALPGKAEDQDEMWNEIGELLEKTWTIKTFKEQLKSKYTLIKK